MNKTTIAIILVIFCIWLLISVISYAFINCEINNAVNWIKNLWNSGNIAGRIITVFTAIFIFVILLPVSIIYAIVNIVINLCCNIGDIISKYCFTNKE